jgi:CBS domain-containing membrane protein
MLALRCLHPPGGAVALTAAFGSAAIDTHGFAFALWPVGLNSVCLVAVGLAFNNLVGRRYPHVPAPAPPVPETAELPPSLRAGVQPGDVEAAIGRLDRGLDLPAADVVALVRDAEANALDRRLGGLRVADVMARDVVVVGPAESMFRARLLMVEHGVKALPVVTSERRLAGIVAMADLFNQDPGDLTSVATVMTTPVTTISEGAPVADLVALMTDLDLRHVPVVDDEEVLVGIVTRAELIAAMHRALVGGGTPTAAG